MKVTETVNTQTDYTAVIELIDHYFDGLYQGDVEKLRRIFHEDAFLKGNGYRKSRDEWLDAVANRPKPADNNFPFGFKTESLDIIGDQAVTKLNVPLPAAHFIDYLSLLKEDGEWRIVNKLFTTI